MTSWWRKWALFDLTYIGREVMPGDRDGKPKGMEWKKKKKKLRDSGDTIDCCSWNRTMISPGYGNMRECQKVYCQIIKHSES